MCIFSFGKPITVPICLVGVRYFPSKVVGFFDGICGYVITRMRVVDDSVW